jgi:hypothetical protein
MRACSSESNAQRQQRAAAWRSFSTRCWGELSHGNDFAAAIDHVSNNLLGHSLVHSQPAAALGRPHVPLVCSCCPPTIPTALWPTIWHHTNPPCLPPTRRSALPAPASPFAAASAAGPSGPTSHPPQTQPPAPDAERGASARSASRQLSLRPPSRVSGARLERQGTLLALYVTDPIITLVAGLLKVTLRPAARGPRAPPL